MQGNVGWHPAVVGAHRERMAYMNVYPVVKAAGVVVTLMAMASDKVAG